MPRKSYTTSHFVGWGKLRENCPERYLALQLRTRFYANRAMLTMLPGCGLRWSGLLSVT